MASAMIAASPAPVEDKGDAGDSSDAKSFEVCWLVLHGQQSCRPRDRNPHSSERAGHKVWQCHDVLGDHVQ